MSFGYSIGDCIVICQLANNLRGRFASAPHQFTAITNELISLSNVLRDIEGVLAEQALSDWRKKALTPILEECHNVLTTLGKVVDENYFLDLSNVHSLRDKSRRVWRRLAWEPDDIQELRSRISLNIGFLNAFNGSLLSKAILLTKDDVERLHIRQDMRERDKEDQAILDWLSPIDYTTHQSDILVRRQPGTGGWLLESPEFQRWLDTAQQTLFCPGIPGAGKTILTAVTIHELTTRFRDDLSVGISYLYCNFQRKDEQTVERLLASLLKQLSHARPSLPKSLKSLYYKHFSKQTRPTLDEISKTLQSVASLYSRVIIIVDALDECQISNGCRATFLTEIFTLQAHTGANLFATSRDIPEIAGKFRGSIICEIRAHDEDVRQYLDSRISQSGQILLQTHREDIITEITKVVGGMFLLAQLYFESVSTKKSLKKMREALKNVPRDRKAYDHAYKDAMERISGQDSDSKELAKQVLSWISCSRRPLTTPELQCALAVEINTNELDEENLPQIEDMISVCAGLVTVDKESDVIRLVHYTAQEYFERMQNTFFPEAESEITITCVTYLSFGVFESGFCQTNVEFKDRLQLHKLYAYASQNWGHHARAASVLIPEVISFLDKTPQAEASSQGVIVLRLYRDGFPKRISGLHLAAYFGMQLVVEAILKKKPDLQVNIRGEYTPLHLASINGHVEVVRALIESGADVSAAPGQYRDVIENWASANRETPFLLTIINGCIEIVDYNSTKNVNMARMRIVTDWHGDTPLHLAAHRGHVDLVKLLLEYGANVSAAPGWHRQTPLHLASTKGVIEVVNLLLEYGADFTATNRHGYTPLFLALIQNHVEVVKRLLQHRNSAGKENPLTIPNWLGETPLHQASFKGQVEIVKLLLENTTDLTLVDKSGDTPLHVASSVGNVDIVKALLEKGADMTALNLNAQTPLQNASTNGHVEVVKLLLAVGQVEVEMNNLDGHDGVNPSTSNVGSSNSVVIQSKLESLEDS